VDKNVKEFKVMRIARKPSPVQFTADKKSDNVEYFNYLGSMTTNDARCTSKIKYNILKAKAALSEKKSLFTSKLDLNIRKKLVKCYILSIALYIVKTLTLRKIDQKYLKSFDMWCWRRMEKIS
jgi:hypothetical protein